MNCGITEISRLHWVKISCSYEQVFKLQLAFFKVVAYSIAFCDVLFTANCSKQFQIKFHFKNKETTKKLISLHFIKTRFVLLKELINL